MKYTYYSRKAEGYITIDEHADKQNLSNDEIIDYTFYHRLKDLEHSYKLNLITYIIIVLASLVTTILSFKLIIDEQGNASIIVCNILSLIIFMWVFVKCLADAEDYSQKQYDIESEYLLTPNGKKQALDIYKKYQAEKKKKDQKRADNLIELYNALDDKHMDEKQKLAVVVKLLNEKDDLR